MRKLLLMLIVVFGAAVSMGTGAMALHHADGVPGVAAAATMIFPVRTLVSYVSQFMSLQPGDIISTGTPPGVGMGQKPQVYLKGGERIRLGVEGLGVQMQNVRPAL